ncbi:PEP-CTERM sorting domain-containing protein [Thiorhodovibrio frisius]|nr:PEP-CTERM sorting domain-containing protein [Thiorhodovibrio frisius]
MASTAHGAVLYDEDFEDGSTDWSSGTIISDPSDPNNNYLNFGSGGSYSWLGGQRNDIGPTWMSSVDVFLDPASAANGNYGFEFTQAITDVDDNPYRQDNLFHVGAYQIRPASQGSPASYALGVTVPNPHHSTSSEGNDPSYYVQQAYNNDDPLFTVTAANWYTFSWEFSPTQNDEVLVDWSMYDADGNEVLDYESTSVLSAAEMGGNSYMWFIGASSYYDSLSIDNVRLTSPDAAVPEPATMSLLGLGLLGALGGLTARRREKTHIAQ